MYHQKSINDTDNGNGGKNGRTKPAKPTRSCSQIFVVLLSARDPELRISTPNVATTSYVLVGPAALRRICLHGDGCHHVACGHTVDHVSCVLMPHVFIYRCMNM